MADARYSDVRIYGRLLGQARPYLRHLISMFALSAAATPLTLLTPVPVKLPVDNVLAGRPLLWFPVSVVPEHLVQSTVGLLALFTGLLRLTTVLLHLQALGNWLLQTSTGERLVLDFRSQLFRHVQRLSLAYHNAIGTADSTYRIRYDAQSIQYILVNGGIQSRFNVTSKEHCRTKHSRRCG